MYVLHIVLFIVFFPLRGETRFLYIWWENTKRGKFFSKKEGGNLGGNYVMTQYGIKE